MHDPFATVDDLQARLDWILSTEERGVADGALADLSEDARYYGSEGWTSSNAPRQVRSLVLRAAARYMRNPDGYTQSRAGDETLQWGDQGEGAGSPHFTSQEKQILAGLSGKGTNSIVTVPLTAWGPMKNPAQGYVPIEGSGYAGKPKEFPFFSEDGGPW